MTVMKKIRSSINLAKYFGSENALIASNSPIPPDLLTPFEMKVIKQCSKLPQMFSVVP